MENTDLFFFIWIEKENILRIPRPHPHCRSSLSSSIVGMSLSLVLDEKLFSIQLKRRSREKKEKFKFF